MTIVAAVDDTEDAAAIVEEAAVLAEKLSGGLHIVHVREYSDLEDDPDSDADVDTRSVRRQVRDVAARIGSSVVEEFTPVGRIGQPASEVVSYAESTGATHLVIGGKQRSPVGKAVFGNTTQRILLDANCSVVTVPLTE